MNRLAGSAVVPLLLAVARVAATGPSPSVTGPVASVGIPGTPAHNYTFFATTHDLASHGYVEEEFFVEGTANRYTTPPQATATIVDGNHPFKTRLVVRRPADAKRFNGTVLVEWNNVTNGFDAENVWFFAWEHILRDGYIWVGVSAQNVGVTALKKFSGERYGTLDVTDGGTVSGDGLSFDIFSQAGQAIKSPGTIDVLRGLKPRHVFAIGESQSASRLSTYVNSIHPLAKVYDGFLLLSSLNQKIRTDLNAPVWKISTEYDVGAGEASSRQADTDMVRSWEVAGTAHVDHHLRQSREPLELRDNATSSEATMSPTCGVPTIGTRVPVQYVVASAFDLLVKWVEKKTAPPTAPPLVTTTTERSASTAETPASGAGRGGRNQITISRDANGLASGGIRLAEVAVPTGLNVGTNSGPGACVRWGYYKPFDVAMLNKLYPTHAAYVSAVERVTNENLRAGYILKADAERTIQDARASAIGRLDSLETERGRPMADFDRAP
jgi:alpha/beta hydrolase family protein